MHPEICRIGPLVIYSYGLTMAVAFLASVNLACSQAKKEGIKTDFVYNLGFITFIFGIIGSRAFFVIENAGYYLANPLEIIMLSRGGMSWFGGFFLGVAAAVIYIRLKKYDFYRIADLFSPFLALGQSIGRIGCFLNGCCFGREGALIPAQIISSFLLLLIFIVLRLMQERTHKVGQIFFSYLLLYSIKRFSVEFIRQDNKDIFYGATLFQLISTALFVFAVLKLLSLSRSRK
jgi:phosphatidylglycerol:prolipoprotein diacylglycerol transferase